MKIGYSPLILLPTILYMSNLSSRIYLTTVFLQVQDLYRIVLNRCFFVYILRKMRKAGRN